MHSVEQVVGEQGNESEGESNILFHISFTANTLLQPCVVSEEGPGSLCEWCPRRAWAVKIIGPGGDDEYHVPQGHWP